MPTVNLNKKVFDTLVGKKLPIEKLKDRISMLGTDLESVEGNEIQVEIFPNRPDMLSEQGFARAFASFIGTKKGLRNYEVKKSGYKVIVDKNVSMRPYTACAIVKNIKFTDEKIRELMQIQEKLAMTHGRNRNKSAYGIYPLEKINFPIKYIAKDPKTVTFWPLGLDKPMSAHKVEQLHPKGREYANVAKDWKKYPFFIDAKENVLCMLPFTNSHDTGKIELDTKEVFIECTGTDLNNVMVALAIFTTTMADMGGDIYSLDIEYHNKTMTTPDLKPKKAPLNRAYINKLLGLDLSENEMKDCLEKMGYGYEGKKVLVPAYRYDILHQVDFAEDIAIAYGYENIEETIPNVATIGKEAKIERLGDRITEILIGLGLTETKSYVITNKEHQTTLMRQNLEVVEIANSLSGEFNCVRTWVLPSLMEVFKNNKHNEYPQNLFDRGRIAKKNSKSDTGTVENERLCVALCSENANFTSIKQVFDHLMHALNLTYSIKETKHDSFIEGRVGRISVNGKEVAYLGEVHPEVLENFELEYPIAAFELNLTEILDCFDLV